MRFPSLAIGLTTCALLAGSGCGGATAHQRKPAPALRTTVTELESRTRADRRKIGDLEHELSSLKLRVAEAEANPMGSLPVEVRAPTPTADELGEEYGQVVGVDEDGIEIVYMGDAARPGSVAPRLPAYATSRAPAPRSSSATRPTIERQMAGASPAGAADESWDVSDRLAVTDRVGPTVGQRVQDVPPPMLEPPPVIAEPPAVTAEPAPVTAEPPAARRPAHTQARRAEPRTRRPSSPPRHTDLAKAAYEQHLATLRAGDHDQAARGFRAFLDEFPEHDLADNAQYWLGESMYDRKLYREALVAFGAVIERYPGGNKVPDALLKRAYCHLALQENVQARAALARVIEMFPKSHPAALAAERLEALAE